MAENILPEAVTVELCRLITTCPAASAEQAQQMLIPTKVGTDSDLIPVTRSDAMPVTFGGKRRWRFYGA
jgi:hypothetical protein